MKKIIIILIVLFFTGVQFSSFAQSIDEMRTLINNKMGDETFLKEFDSHLKPNSIMRSSVVLSKNTEYKFYTYVNSPEDIEIKLYDKGEDNNFFQGKSYKKGVVSFSFKCNNTGVYHLFVKNLTDKELENIVALTFVERFEKKSEETIANSKLAPEKAEFGGMEYYYLWGLDQEPLFGGAKNKTDSKDEFIKFLQKEINFPKEAIDPNADREVLIQFIVTKEGFIYNAVLAQDSKSYHPAIQQEVSRALYSSPKWKPGIKDGKPVNALMITGLDLNTILKN